MEVGDRAIRFQAGEKIALRDLSAPHYCELLEGSVRLRRFTPDGGEAIVGLYMRGDSFPLHGDDAERQYEAISRVLMVLHRPAVKMYPWIIKSFEKELSKTQLHISVLSRYRLKSRVAAYLINLSKNISGYSFKLPFPRYDISRYLCTTESSLSRALKSLEEERAIIRKASAITIVDICRLMEISNDS